MICSVVFNDFAIDLIDYYFNNMFLAAPLTIKNLSLYFKLLHYTDIDEILFIPKTSLNSSTDGTYGYFII